jgi:hypothetical protein
MLSYNFAPREGPENEIAPREGPEKSILLFKNLHPLLENAFFMDASLA